MAEAYENSFLYGEHTWGMNGSYGGRDLWGDEWKHKLPVAQQQNYLASYDDHRDYNSWGSSCTNVSARRK